MMPPDEPIDFHEVPGEDLGAGVEWEPPTVLELQGMLIGYEVAELIGRGGMGAVYKARQISLDRWVAIKLLPPALWEDPSYGERFRNEARMMARLMHPGMVAVFDFGSTPDAQLYFVMEYVNGTDVSRMLAAQGILPPQNAMSIAVHVCDTLAYAHDHGVVHRDIKPANVMVDWEGRVKVADFGLAKVSALDSAGIDNALTMGSPDYIAPECLVTDSNEDHRADLYSLGVMLYEMLVGVVPKKNFFMPSDRVRGLDPRLNAIVIRAMQHDPDDRYQSAKEFRDDIHQVLSGPAPVPKAATGRHPAPPRPEARIPGTPARGPRAPQPSARPPVQPLKKESAVPWALLIVVALLAGVGATWYFVSGPGAPRDMLVPLGDSATRQGAQAAAHSLQAAETAQKLEQMERTFRTTYEQKIATPHRLAISDLDVKYLSAINRAILAKSAADGQSDDVPFLLREKERVEKLKPMPKEDSPDLPESVLSLRRTYRTALGEINEARIVQAQPFYTQYDQELAALEAALAKDARESEVLQVRTWRRAVMEAAFSASLVAPPEEPNAALRTSTGVTQQS